MKTRSSGAAPSLLESTRALRRAESRARICVFVKGLSSRTHTFGTWRGERVLALMRRIAPVEGVSPCDQRLIYAGKQLEEGRTLASYGIDDYSTLHLVLRLRGC